MAEITEVARHISTKFGELELTTDKLDVLVYYSQALSLVKRGKPLFEDDLYAWMLAPASPVLYEHYVYGLPIFVSKEMFEPSKKPLTLDEIVIVDRVCEKYGNIHRKELGDMVRASKPWIDGRRGHDSDDDGGWLIPKNEIAEYYKNSIKSDYFNILPENAIKDLTKFSSVSSEIFSFVG